MLAHCEGSQVLTFAQKHVFEYLVRVCVLSLPSLKSSLLDRPVVPFMATLKDALFQSSDIVTFGSSRRVTTNAI